MEGKTGILAKHENRVIFILQIGDQTLMKLDIKKDLMSQMFHFQLASDPGTWAWRGETEILENA